MFGQAKLTEMESLAASTSDESLASVVAAAVAAVIGEKEASSQDALKASTNSNRGSSAQKEVDSLFFLRALSLSPRGVCLMVFVFCLYVLLVSWSDFIFVSRFCFLLVVVVE